jgi:hypothetical protein
MVKLQIDKKKQKHIVEIFYMWMFCITLKERNTNLYVQNWHSPSHLCGSLFLIVLQYIIWKQKQINKSYLISI